MFIIILFNYNKDLSITLLVNWYFLEFSAEMSKFKSLFTIIMIHMCVCVQQPKNRRFNAY